MKRILGTAVVLGLAIGVFLIVGLDGEVHHSDCPDNRFETKRVVLPEDGIPGFPTPSLEKFSIPPDVLLSDSQKRELKGILRGIEEAYTNCQVKILRSRMDQVPDCFYRVSRTDYLELNGFLYAETFSPNYLDKDKYPLTRITEENDVKGFEDYVHACFEAARFVGDFLVRRGTYGINQDDLRRIESKLLYRLQVLKQYFHGTGKRDFEKLTDALIAEWHEQIESQKGLTRRYARHQVELYLFARWQKPNECWSSNEWILKHGRAQADSLVRLGYTPKWLDSDFPLPVK